MLSLPNTIYSRSAAAAITYTVTTTDNLDPAPAVTCTPASGQAFSANQVTTVSCTSTDTSGNSATGSFQVVVGEQPLHINGLSA
jgi:hypothetical protein